MWLALEDVSEVSSRDDLSAWADRRFTDPGQHGCSVLDNIKRCTTVHYQQAVTSINIGIKF